MKCDCCELPIPDTSLRLLCPPCAQSMVIPTHNTSQLVCKLHARQVHWEAWDNHPVRT